MPAAVGQFLHEALRARRFVGCLLLFGTPQNRPPSWAKRRISEALAALLVAHHRRQQEQAERDCVPLA